MYAPPPPRQRAAAALAAAVLVVGMGLALVFGFAPRWQRAAAPALTAVDIGLPPPSPTPPPEPPPPRPIPRSAPTGSPAPENLHGTASPVFAPPLQVPLVPPPPISAAPQPDLGSAAQTGASDRPGPGTGAGGMGDGTGGGGTGGNGSGGAVSAPRQIAGKLAYSDLPPGLIAPGAEAGVSVRYTVTPEGAATDCRIDRSSGFPALDAAACRLIEQRFRFRPARDRQRRPVSATLLEDHVWVRAPEH